MRGIEIKNKRQRQKHWTGLQDKDLNIKTLWGISLGSLSSLTGLTGFHGIGILKVRICYL